MEQEWIALKSEGLFLCAEIDGRITLSRSTALAWESFFPLEPQRRQEVFDALGLLTPRDVLGLAKVRVGGQQDGGYVLLDDFEAVEAVYSLGVGYEASFDAQLARMGKKIFMFDHTVIGPPIAHEDFCFFGVKIGAENDEAKGIHTLDHQIRALGHRGSRNLILKIDVEGDEYDILSTTTKSTFRHCRQMVLELHGLLNLGNREFRRKFLTAISRLNEEFTLFHVHANNYGQIGFVCGFTVADVLELSYVRSDLVESSASKTIYPTILDFPNHPARPDHLLWFHPFMPLMDEPWPIRRDGLKRSIDLSNRMFLR